MLNWRVRADKDWLGELLACGVSWTTAIVAFHPQRIGIDRRLQAAAMISAVWWAEGWQ
jgi:hypothetical protein